MSNEANNRPGFQRLNRRTFLKSTLAVGALPTASALLAACGDTAPATSTNQLAPVKLTYSYRIAPPRDLQAVQDELNKILKSKINATIELKPLDPGSYDQKVKLAFTGGEEMDLVFTAPWTNNYYQNVANGNLLALDDLLPKYAPKLYASMSPAVWNAARVNGKIYAVINQQIFVKLWGVEARKDLTDKYHVDVSTFTKYEDLEPYLEQLKKNEPDITPIFSDSVSNGVIFRPEYYGFDPVFDGGGIAIKADDPKLQAFNVYATPELRQAVELARKWYQAGYFSKDPLPSADAIAAMKAGKYGMILHVASPGGNQINKVRYGFDFVQQPFAKPLLTTGGVTATLTGIPRTSANPERAMMYLELINTDKPTYNLLTKGIEGKHWVWVDKAKEVISYPSGITAKTSSYAPNADWMFGDQFNAYYTDPAQVGSWDETQKLNKSATPSQALGFAFDTSNVQTQVAQVAAVIKQYSLPLGQGRTDPAQTLPTFLGALKDAGQQDIIDEVQKQLEAWKKTNKK